MKFHSIILVFALAFSANALFAQGLKHQHNIDDSKIALQGFSPVSYIDLGIAQMGSKAFKTVYQDVAYYFTDADQKAKFDKNPGKYLPEYGGYCAFGVYVGAKFRVNPYKFKVIDDKLYLFLYDLEVDAQQLWNDGKDSERIKKANANWEELRNKV